MTVLRKHSSHVGHQVCIAPADQTSSNKANDRVDLLRPKRVVLDWLNNKKTSQSWSKAIKVNSNVPSVTDMVIESSSFMWHDTGTCFSSSCLITKTGHCTTFFHLECMTCSDESRYITCFLNKRAHGWKGKTITSYDPLFNQKTRCDRKRKECLSCNSQHHQRVILVSWKSKRLHPTRSLQKDCLQE